MASPIRISFKAQTSRSDPYPRTRLCRINCAPRPSLQSSYRRWRTGCPRRPLALVLAQSAWAEGAWSWVSDATAAYVNPAGLGLLGQPEAQVGFMVVCVESFRTPTRLLGYQSRWNHRWSRYSVTGIQQRRRYHWVHGCDGSKHRKEIRYRFERLCPRHTHHSIYDP